MGAKMRGNGFFFVPLSEIMRKKMLAAVFAVALMAALPAIAEAPGWEVVDTSAASVSMAETVEVEVRDGYIYVATSKPITVKILSIVGRTISEQKLPAGVSRLKVASRGIYILKAGDTTMRVTI